MGAIGGDIAGIAGIDLLSGVRVWRAPQGDGYPGRCVSMLKSGFQVHVERRISFPPQQRYMGQCC